MFKSWEPGSKTRFRELFLASELKTLPHGNSQPFPLKGLDFGPWIELNQHALIKHFYG